MMKRTKLIVIPLLVLVVYLVIAVGVPFEHNASFAVSLSAGILAILLGTLAPMIAFEKSSENEKILMLSLLRSSAIYIAVQLLLSLICMGIGWVPVWGEIILFVILLCVFATHFYFVVYAGTSASERETVVTDEKRNFTKIKLKIKLLMESADNNEIGKRLEEIYEFARYSDPMSNSEVRQCEMEIEQIIYNVENAIKSGNFQKALECCDELTKKIKVREELCLLVKRK